MLISDKAAATEPVIHGYGRLLRLAYTGRRKFATAAAGLLVLVVGFHVVVGANGLTAYASKRQQTAALARQIEQLKLDNERLAEHNKRLQTDRNAIETSIRQHLHFVKPNEVTVMLPDSAAGKPQN